MKLIPILLFIIMTLTINVSLSYCDDFQNEIEKLVAVSERATIFHKDASDMMLALNNTNKALQYSDFFKEVVVPFRNEIEWLVDLAMINQCVKWEDTTKKNCYIYILTRRIKEVKEDVEFRIKVTNILLANTTIPNLPRLMEEFKRIMRTSLPVLEALEDARNKINKNK